MSGQFVSDRFKVRSREIVSSWHELAACQEMDYDNEGRTTKEQRELCSRCPVRQDCLREALDLETGLPVKKRYGIRGGLSPRERWALQRMSCVDCSKVVSLSDKGVPNRLCDSCYAEHRKASREAYDERRLLAS